VQLNTTEFVFPAGPGTYVLLLRADGAARVQAGGLGLLELAPGWYAYAGSALGPGGLRGRLRRHLASAATHWHVDYLKPPAPIREIWCAESSLRREHLWAAALAGLSGAEIPFRRFGASDCRCAAHLVYFPHPPRLDQFQSALTPSEPGAPQLQAFRLP
jgi:Uri superfamily endonuclease